MNMNPKGLEILKRYEGLALKSYLCPAGIPTIGYGDTGPRVKLGQTITKEEAEARLAKRLVEFEKGVLFLTKGCTLNENEFSALVSLAYNIGLDIDEDNIAEGLGDSSLLKKLLKGDRLGAANGFRSWVYAGGKKISGLVNRREEERALFLFR